MRYASGSLALGCQRRPNRPVFKAIRKRVNRYTSQEVFPWNSPKLAQIMTEQDHFRACPTSPVDPDSGTHIHPHPHRPFHRFASLLELMRVIRQGVAPVDAGLKRYAPVATPPVVFPEPGVGDPAGRLYLRHS